MQTRLGSPSKAIFGAVLLVMAAFMATPSHAASPTNATPAFPHVGADAAGSHAIRIVAFGSSSTEGVGASSPAASYPRRLAAVLGQAMPGVDVAVLNRGIGGQDAEEFHTRIDAIIAERPDLVIFQTGTNDSLRELGVERFVALTRADLAALRNAGVDVMLMEPQFCRVFADKAGSFAYVEAIRALGREFGIPVVRRWDMMKDWLARRVAPPSELQAQDGLHMADRGYDLLAREVARVILDDVRQPVVIAAAQSAVP